MGYSLPSMHLYRFGVEMFRYTSGSVIDLDQLSSIFSSKSVNSNFIRDCCSLAKSSKCTPTLQLLLWRNGRFLVLLLWTLWPMGYISAHNGVAGTRHSSEDMSKSSDLNRTRASFVSVTPTHSFRGVLTPQDEQLIGCPMLVSLAL